MLGLQVIAGVCLAYVVLLFAVAALAERTSRTSAGWLRSPLVYTLALSVYCTAWTFYGAVGSAARSGLEFLTIYLGPTLVMIGWWTLLRRLVRIGRAERITSIADLISSRFGKSAWLGAGVVVLSVAGTAPYIALQLQSVTVSFAVFVPGGTGMATPSSPVALLTAAGLAAFAILFGTRRLDANERHSGIVAAIALEAVVKLIALVAVGVVVVVAAGGAEAMLARIDASPMTEHAIRPGRWLGVTALSAAAFICLPRMFHVLVVENADERHLATASWAFPLYLALLSLFVVPIAATGLTELPPDANPDLFVLTVPLAMGHDGLALLAFLGGFSSATSMVLVAAVALATMVSNNVVLPLWLSPRRRALALSGDVRRVVLVSRRLAIAAILGLGYGYLRLSGGGAALAAIGLISFAGVAQVLPALLGGLYWRGATRAGAGAGLAVGFGLWFYTLLLPSLAGGPWIEAGPFGVLALRPQNLLGLGDLDPLLHALVWSSVLNVGAFVFVSLVTSPGPLERLQAAAFVTAVAPSPGRLGSTAPAADAGDLLAMAQRLLGAGEARRFFQEEAARQGRADGEPLADAAFLERLERKLAGSVGAATAHAMLTQITRAHGLSVEDMMRVADEAAQIMEQSAELRAKSRELSRTARQLSEANAKLTALSSQKDAFLGQVSHELRTPMTSIRAFAEILQDAGLPAAARRRYAGMILSEAERLTRLLDDLLDISVLERGEVRIDKRTVRLETVLDRAVASAGGGRDRRLTIRRDRTSERVLVDSDPDRLAQVFINVIANAEKYCPNASPVLVVRVSAGPRRVDVDFIDNGDEIPEAGRVMMFEKFARLGDTSAAGGAGLGLAISRDIARMLGGDIRYLAGQGGAAFRVSIPRPALRAA